jgi:hypothetical protein
MGFFINIQIAENRLYEIHLSIVSNIAFSASLGNKKTPICNAYGSFYYYIKS